MARLALSVLQEGVVGGADPLEEQVVAGQELRVALQQEHRDRQHSPQDVREAVSQLRRSKDRLGMLESHGLARELERCTHTEQSTNACCSSGCACTSQCNPV